MIYEKLLKIQTELKAPKSQYNKFGGYNYRNCEDILESVKPLLVTNKTAIVVSDELVLIGNRYYVKATAKLIDAETGECVENTAFAREEETKKGMDGSQITGASSSYARKYALNGLFAIDDTKDSDTTNQEGKGTQKPQINGQPPKVICSICKKEVHTVKMKDGSEMQAIDFLAKYGMCPDCYKKQVKK